MSFPLSSSPANGVFCPSRWLKPVLSGPCAEQAALAGGDNGLEGGHATYGERLSVAADSATERGVVVGVLDELGAFSTILGGIMYQEVAV